MILLRLEEKNSEECSGCVDYPASYALYLDGEKQVYCGDCIPTELDDGYYNLHESFFECKYCKIVLLHHNQEVLNLYSDEHWCNDSVFTTLGVPVPNHREGRDNDCETH